MNKKWQQGQKVTRGVREFTYGKNAQHERFVSKKLAAKMGRINVELPDELEKKLRFKTIERFGGKKGDLSKAVEEAVKTWVAKENTDA